MKQPTLFEGRGNRGNMELERVVLFALGDFQARGKVLAERELPLDRLRGALRRACEAHALRELTDEEAADAFRILGAEVRQVPPFVAKHPFRVTVHAELAERAQSVYKEMLASMRQS